jgi:hypothetical protein
MNAEVVRKDSKFCKRLMRITAIFAVQSAKLIDRRGFYPLSAQVRLDLRIVVPPDLLEQSIRGVGHLFRRLRMGKIKFKRGLEEPFRFIAGNFNQWNQSSHPLNKSKQGIWKISLPLDPGHYEYRFFVDEEWQNDPTCSSFVENSFGTFNCLKIVE